MSTQPLIYLRRPPDWEEHEKPSLPGSPGMIAHPSWMRVCYALVAVLVGITGGLGNALFVANLPTIQEQMGLTNLEASWLTGAYVTFNVTANMLVYKFRQQFGMRLFTEIGLGLYATLCVLHLFLGSTASLMWLRGASGLVAAACISLGTLYMLQALPRKYVFKTLMLGLGISQLAAPLAWVLSPGLLEHGQWDNLYVFEAGLALLSFAAVIVLKLPSGVHIKVFEWRDFISMSLLIPGVGLLVAFLVQGSILSSCGGRMRRNSPGCSVGPSYCSARGCIWNTTARRRCSIRAGLRKVPRFASSSAQSYCVFSPPNRVMAWSA